VHSHSLRGAHESSEAVASDIASSLFRREERKSGEDERPLEDNQLVLDDETELLSMLTFS
jgi:hypothetical protein